jgi:hypothetical protein
MTEMYKAKTIIRFFIVVVLGPTLAITGGSITVSASAQYKQQNSTSN